MNKKPEKEFYIWEGIYKTFKEAPTVGPGFSGNTWKERSLANIENILKLSKEKKTIPEFVVYRESLLAPLLATLTSKSKTLKIIDLGGNLGQEFLSIIGSTKIKNMQYTVIEKEEMCKVGNKLFKKDKRIQFIPNLPASKERVDIIHIGSTLQYIENWKSLFKELVEFEPSYIVFTDLQAGDIPTYVTIQNYYNSKMPVWFFNVKEVMDEFKKLRYKLAFQSTFRGHFMGKEQDRPQSNLPKKFQLKNSCNLLFKSIK